ncbi:AlpA family transcriptional regulator [Idiomarina sp. Sol25]|jgi:prophage regulatory protein|uniref:helix-turn-helix transcriptional regulator n=1 Tax=Idiomarina sp. Sol25 TaxID=3064000 RepID=UPI00294B575F|nr:AlpA family transcriptional regulator [Idiomarina sp. Sol25]MDV6326865.1 AlpA family transcriptional regulator [Idiomarina sp. Sol25]
MKLMKVKEVMHATSLARPTIYKYMAKGQFPKPVSLGGRAVAWVADEIDDWIMQCIAERDAEEEKDEQ